MSETDGLKLSAPVGKHPHRPLFVYLPGMDGSGELFSSQSDRLRHHFDIRCLMIPGDDLSSWESLASQVVRLIRQEAGAAPVYLCGESFGACLALQTVALAPTLASHLILVNSASSFYRFPWLHWLANLTPWVAPPIYRSSALSSLPMMANLNRIGTTNREALERAISAVSQTSTAWRMGLLSEFRLGPLRLHRIKANTLLIASLSDHLLPSLEESQRLATLLPNPRIYSLPDSGHISLLEDGVDLNAILAAVGFLPKSNRDRSVPTPKNQASSVVSWPAGETS